jgi:hypothetical protein
MLPPLGRSGIICFETLVGCANSQARKADETELSEFQNSDFAMIVGGMRIDYKSSTNMSVS